MKICAAHYRTGEVREFTFEKGRFVSSRPSKSRSPWFYGPGFFDIQCNGFAGVDFNHPQFSAEGFRAAIEAMWRHGATHVMPTVITASPERMAASLRTLAEAVRQFPEIRSSVAGIHQEGPYFANVDGVRGAHPPEKIISPTAVHFNRLQKAAGGMIRMVTLAPEIPDALPFIRTLTRRGIVVAIGHTNATPSEIDAAIRAGAKTSTHLGNGSAQLLPRHHNYMLAQLGEDRLFASFIADGHHLPPWALRSFLRAKTPERCILITDAMAGAGAPPGRYTLGRLVIEVGRDRVARQPGQPNFAGAAITMAEGIRHAMRWAGIPLETAWDMSSVHAWKLMRGAAIVSPPRLADAFVIARPDSKRLAIKATVLNRRLVYSV